MIQLAKKEVKEVKGIKEIKPNEKVWSKENEAKLTEVFQKHTWKELLVEFEPFDKLEIQAKAKELKL